ncbi:zinc ABC transporter substrate-binding protein ZnuA [Vibrio gallicus]|uniref:zinc ABC transporter substrate-binding protein ZnuA n=1 Tax=Vibrio gallicus TaxID=190897 RepID=UPI0021C2EB25|nr:zinc ABC transporter substrate-binding protein ZnuA [Vibrio gallicus]
MKRILLCLACLGFVSSAQAIEVLSSIKPIQLITQEITQNSAKSQALVGSAMSPHDYALRPSDLKKIRSADLVIWYGNDLEAFMAATVEGQQNVLTISEIPQLERRAFAEEHAHAHEGHDHGTHDPHVWLGPKQVAVIATAIAHKLSAMDPDNAVHYQQNLDQFLVQLHKTVLDIDSRLSPLKANGYYVFHDAYGYFEESFGLNHLGAFTVSPERKPGARSLIQIKTRLAKGDVKCVFSEPQYQPAIIETVTRGSAVNRGELDALASRIEVKPGAYFDFLNQLSRQFETCLK